MGYRVIVKFYPADLNASADDLNRVELPIRAMNHKQALEQARKIRQEGFEVRSSREYGVIGIPAHRVFETELVEE